MAHRLDVPYPFFRVRAVGSPFNDNSLIVLMAFVKICQASEPIMHSPVATGRSHSDISNVAVVPKFKLLNYNHIISSSSFFKIYLMLIAATKLKEGMRFILTQSYLQW